METVFVQGDQQGMASEESKDPSLLGAFADDGVDLTLIRWFLSLSCFERLQAAQDMIDTVWMLREAK